MHHQTSLLPVMSFATQPMAYAFLIGCLVMGAPKARCQTHAPAAVPPSAAHDAARGDGFSGKVLETMDAASYTYALLDTGTNKLWVAAPQFAVKVGDTATVADAMPMPHYHSKTLNRDFEVVYFAGRVTLNGKVPALTGQPAALPPNHPPLGGMAAKPTTKLADIKKAAGGKTIAEVVAAKAALGGKPVTVRGQVVKYNAGIMGKNWLHIQDGTGSPGSNDLTVTTSADTKVGDVVLVTGTLTADRDFGSGYRYDLIIEDAKVTVE